MNGYQSRFISNFDKLCGDEKPSYEPSTLGGVNVSMGGVSMTFGASFGDEDCYPLHEAMFAEQCCGMIRSAIKEAKG